MNARETPWPGVADVTWPSVLTDPRRRTYYWIEEGRDRWVSDDMSDIFAIRKGLVSVTPLQSDTTHHAVLPAFRGWQADLNRFDGR